MDRQKAKEIIKVTVIKSINEFAKKSLTKKAKFQILDLIIPKERRIRSIVGGLETSLGTTLWEPLAKALAIENGFEVIESNLQSPSNMPASLSNTLDTVVNDRCRADSLYNAKTSHDEIKKTCRAFIKRPIDSFETAPSGFGVDIWLIKDGINYFFDTKTVQPNIGALTSCLKQVLNWYAFFYSKNPTEQAEARIVFPYNPYPGQSFWERTIGKGRPLEAGTEAWVEDQFWDFCSGLNGTYLIINESFTEIRESRVL